MTQRVERGATLEATLRTMLMRTKLVSTLLLLAALVGVGSAQDRDTKVRNDRQSFVDSEFWIYDNLEHGRDLARSTGRPLLVVFRCVP